MSSSLRQQREPMAPTLHTAADYIFRHHVFDEPHVAGRPSFLAVVAATCALWRRRHMTRRHLSMLDDRGLADVGLERAARNGEVAKYFWQA